MYILFFSIWCLPPKVFRSLCALLRFNLFFFFPLPKQLQQRYGICTECEWLILCCFFPSSSSFFFWFSLCIWMHFWVYANRRLVWTKYSNMRRSKTTKTTELSAMNAELQFRIVFSEKEKRNYNSEAANTWRSGEKTRLCCANNYLLKHHPITIYSSHKNVRGASVFFSSFHSFFSPPALVRFVSLDASCFLPPKLCRFQMCVRVAYMCLWQF